ncbi:membrane-bound alpha-1,6- mannosyltransferase Initiation-specific [Puttea exsequens]|nr:membrane-bound alpha-1,6- mannosyltransferase Initiation-specific [Puttea exsequens]
MLTTKRVLVIAAFIFTAFFFLHSSHSAPRSRADLAENLKTEFDTSNLPKSTGIPANVDSPTRPYPPPRPNANRKGQNQKPMAEVVTKSLREQLQYQFPYDRASKFPAYIWQTWKTTPASGDFGEQFRSAEASWTELHPGFVHEVVTDDAAVYLLKHLYASVPEVVEAYQSLPMAVMKADFFRYLILLARGGIYTDIDTTAIKSTTDWIPEEVPRSTIGLIIGIEADPDREDWKEWYSRRIQFCQWTIQAKPGHPVLRDIVSTITEDILRMKKKGILTEKKMDKSIVEFTGPAVWTDAVFNYLNDPTYFKMENGKNTTWQTFTGIETARKVGDVVVLPITSFSPGVGQMNAKEPDDPMAFVKHDFEGRSLPRCSILKNAIADEGPTGTWKPASERIKPERETSPEQSS